MKYKKAIPADLRREYKKELRSLILPTIKAFFRFYWLYKKRVQLFKMGEVKHNLKLDKKHDYWLVDNYEYVKYTPSSPAVLSLVACWWGDANYRDRKKFYYNSANDWQKFWASFRWVILRNSVWNTKIKNGFSFKGDVQAHTINEIYKTGPANVMRFRNNEHIGAQAATYRVKLENGNIRELFRYSYTRPLHSLNPLRLLGYKWANKMRGFAKNRLIYKDRIFKELVK